MDYLRLIGIAIIAVGFAAKLRVTVIVLAAGLATGAAALYLDGAAAPPILETLGRAFAQNRLITLFVLALPALGLCERRGLQEQARRVIAALRAATVGRLQLTYQVIRVAVVALGIRLGSGHVSFSRPLIVPMALGLAREPSPEITERVKAACGASENYGNFFGQNLFPGAAGVLIVVRTLAANGHEVSAVDVSLASLPVAAASLVFGAAQYLMLDRWLAREAAIVSLEAVYVLSGAVLVLIAAASARDAGNPRRLGTACFWLILGVVFAFGSWLPAGVTGILVIALVALDGLGFVRPGKHHEPPPAERARSAEALGHRLFAPVLAIPLLTALAYGAARWLAPGLDANRVLYVALAGASLVAAAAALAITRERPRLLVEEGRRLADAIGAVVILPQLLASLGELFTAAGVGRVIAASVKQVIPAGSLLAVIVVLCATMALFTFLVGNSFAAFPVVMAGIGVPLLIEPFGADPATVGALSITVASCGTLCTPMAANFNIVPAALFEMKDRHGLIRFQAPMAAAMFAFHALCMWAVLGAR